MMISGATSLILVLINVLNNFKSLCCFYSGVTLSSQRVFSQSQHEFEPYVTEFVRGWSSVAFVKEQDFSGELKIVPSQLSFSCPWNVTHFLLRPRFYWNYLYRSLVGLFRSRNLNPITSRSKSSVRGAKNCATRT